MTQSLRHVARGIWEHKLRAILWIVILIALGFLVIWAVRPERAPGWTGFGPDFSSSGELLRAKSLWDWLELLLIPLALLVAAWWLGRFALQIETLPAAVENVPVDSQDSVESRYQENRLQTYFDRMSQLLLDHGLRNSSANDEVRRLARAQTLTALWGLNSERKGAVTRFLYESQLISQPEPIVSLSGANLSSADLAGTNLTGADLRLALLSRANLAEARLNDADLAGADLVGADMRGALSEEIRPGAARWVPPNLGKANLNEANLIGASLGETDLTEVSLDGANLSRADIHDTILRGASLQGADLSEANLKGVNLKEAILTGADLRRAQLSGARLAGAMLSGADLTGANLMQADLKDADLSDALLQGARLPKAYLYRCSLRGANLKEANLRGANLTGADLTDATLAGADLRGVYLSSAKVTGEQLSTALSLEGAVLPSTR